MAEVFKARLRGGAGIDKVLVIKRILPSISSESGVHPALRQRGQDRPPPHAREHHLDLRVRRCRGQFFLAMEYIHGQDLATSVAPLRRGARAHGRWRPPSTSRPRLAKGLNYAHSYISPTGGRIQVVHLDVSPQNVLISYDGAVKLTDFGIASLHRRPGRRRQESAARRATSRRSRRWGRTSTGAPTSSPSHGPVRGAHGGAARSTRPRTSPPSPRSSRPTRRPPSQFRPGMPVNVEEVIMKALHREPHFRYERAGRLPGGAARS